MATATTSDMPLASELSVVNYLRNILGVSSSGTATAGQVGNTLQAVGGSAAGGTATAGQAEELSQDQLSTIMTEWLRGNGQFLENMRQQNVSGLYNTSTQKLVANDLTAQAALKAATANQEIQKANAALQTNANIATAQNQTSASQTTAQGATQASVTNAQTSAANAQTQAKLTTEASVANAKSGAGTSRTDSLINTALAALMNAYKGSKSKSDKESKTAAGKTGTDTSGITETAYGADSFNQAFQSSNAATDFLMNPSYEPTNIASDPSYNLGLDLVQNMQPTEISALEIPYTSPVDMGEYSNFMAPEVMNFGQVASAAPSYDFTPVDYTDSDFYSGGASEDYTYGGGSDVGADWTPDEFAPVFSADDDEFSFGFSWSF